MERPMLSAAIDSCYKEDDIKEILKELVNIFDIEDRVYSLESEKENIPSIVFSFGDLDGKKFSKVYNNFNTNFWESASNKIVKVISKHSKKNDTLLIFEFSYKKARARLACLTNNSKIAKSAIDSLGDSLNLLLQLFKSENIPSKETIIYCGFDEKDKKYKIDRAVIFSPNFIEYAYDERKNEWKKVKLEKEN